MEKQKNVEETEMKYKEESFKWPEVVSREALLKWKAQYGSSPCTYYFRSGTFYIEKLFTLVTKQATLMRR